MVRKFVCQSGREATLIVEVVEQEFAGSAGSSGIYLGTVCRREYVQSDGTAGHSVTYRQHDLPVLWTLLQRAHAFILEQRTVEDVPV